jgi:hypothetical protein
MDRFYLTVELDKPVENFNIAPAPIKYNKDIAYSLTFDDSLLSAYRVAYPLLKGGKISGPFKNDEGFDDGGDGSVSNGLFYTDGCGNSIPFTAGIAINYTLREDKKDIHTGTNNTFLTWDNIKELYLNGWNVLNHSYSHSVHGNTDYKNEILFNTEIVLKKTGILMNQFIIPSNDIKYADYVFKYGMLAVYSGSFPEDSYIEVQDSVSLKNFRLSRNSLKGLSLQENIERFELIVKKYKKIWYNEFTHSCGNDNIWGIGIEFNIFRKYMEYIYSKYGREGKDNIWFAPLQDVYEYLFVKQNIKITVNRYSEKKFNIELDYSNIKNFIDKKDISLITDIPADIIKVTPQNIKKITFNKRLINCYID